MIRYRHRIYGNSGIYWPLISRLDGSVLLMISQKYSSSTSVIWINSQIKMRWTIYNIAKAAVISVTTY